MAKKKKKKNRPSEPKPINAREVTQQGLEASAAQLGQLRGFYGQLAGDIGGSAYAQEARALAQRGAERSDQVNMLGGRLLGVADQVDTQESALEAELRRQAQDDLALGRSLSPEQQREAAQSARQAFAARGLGTSMGSAAAEILNRDRYATQRQDQRRTFALGTNQSIEGTLGARRALAGDLLGRSAGAYETSGNMALNASNALATQNPYNIALGGLGSGAGMIQSGSDLAANTASFNTNMQASIYNSYQNNQAALRAARMNSSASNNAGTMGMIGGVGGGALMGVGLAI
jgi:hypothetical protein